MLLGAIGGPKWWTLVAQCVPNRACCACAASSACTRTCGPVEVHPALRDASAIKPEMLDGVDLVFVRELTGGIYFGEKSRTRDAARPTCARTPSPRVERITRVAGTAGDAAARTRSTSIDKSNVLETSRLWREVAERVMKAEFPDVALEHMLVDSAAMHLIRRPRDFDVHASPRTCSATS